MDNNFMRAMKFTAKWEGLFSNDKADPGGKTKYGVSDAGDGSIDGMIDLDRDGKGDVKVEELTMDQAMEYYYKYYWLAARCNEYDLPMAVAIFDTAVNCGVTRATGWIPNGIDVNRSRVNRYIDNRAGFYSVLIKKNPALQKFQKGWINRVNDLRKFCEILAEEAIPQVSYVTKLEGQDSNNK